MTRLRDKKDDFRALIDATSKATGIRPAYIEKDYWVTELLRSVAAPVPGKDGRPEPVVAIFKGGTSLSKAYGLIQRFSEDVDILLDGPELSGAARDRVLRDLGRRAGADLGLPVTEREKDRGVKRNFEYEYPRIHTADVISPRLRLEMGFRGGPQPNAPKDVRSYIAGQAATQFHLGSETFEEFASVRVAVLAPERTLVERLMCLHAAARHAQEGEVTELCGCVRHYYDVRQLLRSAEVMAGVPAYGGGVEGLVADINEESKAAGFASVDRPTEGFAASPAFQIDPTWMKEVRDAYAATLPQLVWGDCPKFEECLEAVRARRSEL